MREWEVGVQWNRLGVDCDSIVIRNMMIDSGMISLGVEDYDFVIRNRFHFPPILWTLSNRLHFDFSVVLLTCQLKIQQPHAYELFPMFPACPAQCSDRVLPTVFSWYLQIHTSQTLVFIDRLCHRTRRP